MYTSKFRQSLFQALSTSNVPDDVRDVLAKSADCDEEANFSELKIICAYYHKFGEAKTKNYLTTAKEITRSDLTPKKKSKKKPTTKNQTAEKESANATVPQQAHPYDLSQLTDAVDFYHRIYGYTVIRKKSMGELVRTVNEQMKYQWVPYGGVSYAAAGMSPLGNTGNTFLQAMVRIRKN